MKKSLKLISLTAMLIALAIVFGACGQNNETTTPTYGVEETTDGAEETPDVTDVADEPAANETPAVQAGEGFRIALVTDYGSVDDGSFNQGSWEGVVSFAEASGISHTFFEPADQSDAEYINAIELAVAAGAEVVVTPGFLFSSAIYQAQDMWPEVNFILLDTTPSLDGSTRIEDNVVAVFYAEEQAGFLAGYAAVMEGYRSLGFMGGIPVPPVVRFGHGFVEGAEFAAQLLELEAGEVTINYTYVMTFNPTPEVNTQAAAWFAAGTEVIFAAAGGAGFSVFSAAEDAGATAIGVDMDQAHLSPTILTSALKELSVSVHDMLDAHFAGNFPGGQIVNFDASMNGIGLPMDTSRFEVFTQNDYDLVFTELANGSITVSTQMGIGPSELNVHLVVVNEV